METNLNESDLQYLERCLELAEEALQAGDSPLGSILVSRDGKILAEARNRIHELNALAHPEFELARWALDNLNLEERKQATMYTSGEHCPICAAAHGWAQIGGVVYLSSASQLGLWRKEMGAPDSPINFYPIEKIVKDIRVKGPASGRLTERIKDLHLQYHRIHNKRGVF